MIGEKMDSQEILNRLMLAYGVSSQKSLAEALAIPANNISGWLQRGSVPGNPIIKCALDTGSDLRWLVTGEFANANIERMAFKSVPSRSEQGKALIEKMLSTGGKAVLKRVMNAYGFATQKELSEYLGISTGTISTWVRREYFPGDVVIACALDTGVSLGWLATGEMNTKSQEEHVTSEIPTICKKILLAGKLDDDGFCYIDNCFVPEGVNLERLNYVRSGKSAWLIEMDVSYLSNGLWLLDIDGTLDVYSVSKRPGNKLRITGHDGEFECLVDEVTAKGLVVLIFKTTF
ncbi:helix-turn-helix domain-containing protein [Rahnella sp. BCC 1045]|uniref:helix-turn-helix domain-containing protein n=1 Tax=Rahnella sp. BCC 1045 TaxID=2816251 RepID=UPI0020B7DD1E|nr:helix-turn-helix domain-containing protein [Rahnella sp. BCC 1045]